MKRWVVEVTREAEQHLPAELVALATAIEDDRKRRFLVFHDRFNAYKAAARLDQRAILAAVERQPSPGAIPLDDGLYLRLVPSEPASA